MPLLHIIPVSVFLVELFGDLCPVVVVVDDCCSSVVGVCVSSVEEISQNVKYLSLEKLKNSYSVCKLFAYS